VTPRSECACARHHPYLNNNLWPTRGYPTVEDIGTISKGMSRTIALVASSLLIGGAGCAVEEQTGTLAPDHVTSSNGTTTNGIRLNGIRLNGIRLNGIRLNGTPLGVSGTGAPLSGADIVGSTWTAELSDGTTLPIRIDDALQGTGTNSDLWFYKMSYEADGARASLCVDDANNPLYAGTVRGTWNLEQGVPGGGSYNASDSLFTIACRGSSIAKCVEFGYKPWHDAVPELASCVRALRGDYCGDGTPYTVNGTVVNIFDSRGIQTDDASWVPEAAWTPEGAACVSKKKQERFDQVANERPTCYPMKLKPQKSCGTAFTPGIAIITELPSL